MKKERLPSDAAIIGLGVVILAATALALVLCHRLDIDRTNFVSFQQDAVPIYISTGNIYKGFFMEPFESALFIFRDGTFYTFTTQDRDSIKAPPASIYDFLEKKNGRLISDIVCIIHNHAAPALFSEGDKQFYRYMVAKGFKGYFIIYYTFSGKVRILEEGEGE